jgi:hypothetical protein
MSATSKQKNNGMRIGLILLSLFLLIFVCGSAYALAPHDDLYPANDLYPSDFVVGAYTLSASQTTINEADTTITLTISKTTCDFNSSVNLTTINGTALSEVDFIGLNENISFNWSEDSKTVVLSIKDNVNDTSAIKYFYVTLSNPTNGAILGAPNNITINIITPAPTPTPKPYNTHAPGNWLIEFAENLKYLIPCVLIGAIIWFYYSDLNNKGRRRR